MIILTVAICSYLVGSIPFGLFITKALGLGDVRSIGSGNIGATNVLRTGNKGAAIATLLLDVIKGFTPVFICNHYAISLSGLAMLCAVLGHCFPIWLKFKGGKGVATFIGTLFGLYWLMGLLALAVWLIVAFLRKTSSLSSLTMSAMMVLLGFFLTPYYVIWIFLTSIVIFFQHRANITRLRNGTEPKIGQK